MASPADGVELDMLDHGEWGVPSPALRGRAPRWRPAWLRDARGRIGVVSVVLFLGLSWYFSMPSTLYVYAVVVCFTCPMLLCHLLYRRAWATTSLVRRTVLVVVTAWVALSALRGWAPPRL